MFINMNKEIYILGVGHNTIVYVDLLEQCGYIIKGLYHYNDERTGETYFDYPIIGSFADLYAKEDLTGMNFALSMGDNKVRKMAYETIIRLGGDIPTIIHPKADVSKYATLGRGVVVHTNTVVHPEVTIGDNTVISCNCTLIHASNIGSHTYIAGSALIGAYTNMHDNVFVGLGAVLISAKVSLVGESAIIGAGAVVSSPVEANTVVAGVPARCIRKIE